jgi:uncharacterized protein (DUF1810 family)
MTEDDPCNLERFVTAQAPVFETVLAELRESRKRSHWMWFIFPQLTALGLMDPRSQARSSCRDRALDRAQGGPDRRALHRWS